jgi:hypothetical protein
MVRVLLERSGSAPFFSPDGEWLGFAADGKLKKVAVKGGQPQTLCDVAVMPGATWGPDDTIVYSPNFNVGLFAISGRGGKPRRLTAPNHGEFHFLPDFMPGTKEVLFTIWNGTSSSLDEAKTLFSHSIRVRFASFWKAVGRRDTLPDTFGIYRASHCCLHPLTGRSCG